MQMRMKAECVKHYSSVGQRTDAVTDAGLRCGIWGGDMNALVKIGYTKEQDREYHTGV